MAQAALAQDQTMYSWTDENGTVHFTDQKPEGQDFSEQVIPQDEAPAASNPYQQGSSAPSAAQQRRDEIARKNEQSRADKAMASAQCSSWQSEVARLEPNRRVFYTNEQGETERMDDVQRTNRVAELKSQIAQHCN
jgi:hypothetical protein